MEAGANLLAAIASPRRQEILRLIWSRELCAGDIHSAMPDVSFGAVSLQLRTLSEAGLVECRREHRHRFYSARREALGSIGAALERMWDHSLWRLKLLASFEQSRRGRRPMRRRRKPA